MFFLRTTVLLIWRLKLNTFDLQIVSKRSIPEHRTEESESTSYIDIVNRTAHPVQW
jgi:hypothetical protein